MTPTERAHAWQRHMTDWQASGVSGSAYCKQQSLVYHQFVYWRQKLTPTEDSPKQAQGLAVLVEQELGHNPFTGALYAFTNRQRNKIKCLMWEDNGFVLY